MLLPQSVEIVIAAVVLVMVGLGVAARRRLDVAWLRAFDLQRDVMEAQRARRRRTANIAAGGELILLGIMIVLGYFAMTVVFVSSPEPRELAVVGALSGLCVVLGTVAIVRNRGGPSGS